MRDVIDDSDEDHDYVIWQSEPSSSEESNSDHELLELDEPSNDLQSRADFLQVKGAVNIFKGKNGFQWQGTEPPRNTRTKIHNIIRELRGLTALSRTLGNSPSKSDIWKLLINDEMLEQIVTWTNQKIIIMREKLSDSTNTSNYRSTNIVELKALLGLFMLFLIIKSSHEDMLQLFSKDVLGRPIFRMTMSLKRFEILLSCLRLDT
ncbi:uncharacterized protein [Diabrotica undecimpunctata]|uniref:uncharacterized protein n=1 Tax=Diabrotica undecimpunctata TaxID=50387 RepID=UPI003B6324CD